MAPTVRSSSTYASAVTETSTSGLTLPSGWQPGDVIYIGCELTAATGSITTPGGWAAVVPQFASAVGTTPTSGHAATFRRVMQPGDTDPVISFTSGRFAAAMEAIQGADNTTPEDVTAASDDNTGATIPGVRAASVTTVTDNCLLITFHAVRNPNTGVVTAFTPDASETEQADISTSVAVASEAAVEAATLALGAAGATGTKTATATGSNVTNLNMMGMTIAVRPAAVTAVTWTPQRYGQVAPLSPVPWIQRDRRDANTVATAASPLASPLDTAWQADGQYWHLYGDTAARDRRAYFQQRNYVSPPGLLATAELENELLGGAGTAARYGFPAYYDRREVPQQPPRPADPLLIQTALLENELLGSADDLARHRAWYADRREVPQQRQYYLPYAPFLLENELLGGAETAWHAWWQRPGSWPQQRAYISDPSFYPTTAPTDPLTLAWGAGGSYWHLYNRAADITDRREVPQQRNYASDPLLLITALLENELLGGAGTAARYLVPATHADRREVPAQRAYFAALGVALDPVLAAFADLARRYGLPVTHADRRLVPQQRVFFPVPPPPPAVQNATSAPAVTARDASAPTVAGMVSVPAVTAAGGSAAAVGSPASTSAVTQQASSAPAVSDG